MSTEQKIKIPTEGSLYPSVAISDTFNCLGHAYASYIAYTKQPLNYCYLGYSVIAIAALAGIGRFGVCEAMFIDANEDLARLGAYIGLPLIGSAYFKRAGWIYTDFPLKITQIVVCGAILAGCSKSLRVLLANVDLEDLTRTIWGLTMFILPIGIVAYEEDDRMLLGSVVLFLVAGVFVKPERHNYLFGMRREDIFHYSIGIASIGIASRMDGP